jgi:hypothetical protein
LREVPSIIRKLTIALTGAALLMPAAAAAAPGRPALVSPEADANVQSVPAFTWNRVKRADRYEFQLAADTRFGSIVSKGSFQTRNTAASIEKSLPDGEYHWRVRAINAKGVAGRWAERSITKRWSAKPALLAPANGAQVSFPGTPLVLRWSRVPRAYKYRVYIATDPGLGSLAVTDRGDPISTSGTVFSPAGSLAPGRYYWAVEAVDASSHRGTRSAVGSFDWSWPSATATSVSDLIAEPVVMDPHMKWNPVPGAVGYDVEVNFSDDWSVGSKVCCTGTVTGTELSPTVTLPNNVYNWRVRAIDADGNAGQWNVGTPFDKHFGNVPPTIQHLRLVDAQGGPDLPAGSAMTSPVIAWDPVPGAADYEFQIVPRLLGLCDWTDPDTAANDVWRDRVTAATAWTPLGKLDPGVSPPDPRYEDIGVQKDTKQLVDGRDYCFRMRARTGNPVVFSDWTQLGGDGQTSFHYTAPPLDADPLLTTTADRYVSPANLSTTPRLPLLRWKPVQGANSYWVVVAKDQSFTEIFDVAFTRATAYAPRERSLPETYPDDTTPYYWAVLPSPAVGGGSVGTIPQHHAQRAFFKASQPPALLAPLPGSDVTLQPVFRWGWREGAKEYQLQVAQDPTFGNVIDDVKTQATSYTPTKSYPADTVLYWRVRVTDVKKRGLTWSPTRTFRRRLPIPQHAAGNPSGGPTIPALAWLPVQGAESYSIHADQADGTTRDFTLRGTVFTPSIFYGTGVWHWQVRANFPAEGTRVVSSGWSPATPFTRTIPPPDGVNAINRDGRVLIGWEPSVMAKKYKVEISATNSFSTRAFTATTENLAIAPTLVSSAFQDGGRLYWRVAAVDEGDNVGGFATGSFRTPKRMVVRVTGGATRGERGKVEVTVKDARGRAVKKARVKVSGAAHARSRRTNKRGATSFFLRPRRKGTISFRVSRTGYRPGVATLVVR